MRHDPERAAEIERIKREYPLEDVTEWVRRLTSWEKERYAKTGRGGGYFRLIPRHLLLTEEQS